VALAIELATSVNYLLWIPVVAFLVWFVVWRVPVGKFVRPAEAPRFHLVTLVSIVLGAGLALSTLDPIKVTEYSIVLSAAALPGRLGGRLGAWLEGAANRLRGGDRRRPAPAS
jgi:hypothetical protein